jgi:hypothetical protein
MQIFSSLRLNRSEVSKRNRGGVYMYVRDCVRDNGEAADGMVCVGEQCASALGQWDGGHWRAAPSPARGRRQFRCILLPRAPRFEPTLAPSTARPQEPEPPLHRPRRDEMGSAPIRKDTHGHPSAVACCSGGATGQPAGL